MIVVDKNKEIKELLEKNALESGAIFLDELSFEVSTVNNNELYLVHEDILLNKKIGQKFATCAAIVAFNPHEKIEGFPENLKIVALVNKDTPALMLKKQIEILGEFCTEKEFLRSQLVRLNAELNDALSNVEIEMLKVKRMYEKAVPRRIDNIKGMSFYSKYAAGENSGGEFFDLFRDKNKVFVMASATTSYLASSTLISLFTSFKQEKSFGQNALKTFLGSIEEEIKHMNETRQKPIGFDLFIGIFDTVKSNLTGHILGNFNLLSDNPEHSQMGNDLSVKVENLKNSSFQVNMNRGERFLLVSPGLIKNWEEHTPEFHFEKLLKNTQIKPTDVIDEIFFQLKKDAESSFLKYDASVLMMEIDSNAMVEV